MSNLFTILGAAAVAAGGFDKLFAEMDEVVKSTMEYKKEEESKEDNE